MSYILDTHVLLWIFEDDYHLSALAKNEIQNLSNKCFISIVSLYEIAIKKSIGKIETSNTIKTFANEINRIGLTLLPIEIEHLETYLSLPQFDNHKDPFDRLIIATAIKEDLTIITIDEKFKLYQKLIKIVW